jgi:hypothetical protein
LRCFYKFRHLILFKSFKINRFCCILYLIVYNQVFRFNGFKIFQEASGRRKKAGKKS